MDKHLSLLCRKAPIEWGASPREQVTVKLFASCVESAASKKDKPGHRAIKKNPPLLGTSLACLPYFFCNCARFVLLRQAGVLFSRRGTGSCRKGVENEEERVVEQKAVKRSGVSGLGRGTFAHSAGDGVGGGKRRCEKPSSCCR